MGRITKGAKLKVST